MVARSLPIDHRTQTAHDSVKYMKLASYHIRCCSRQAPYENDDLLCVDVCNYRRNYFELKVHPADTTLHVEGHLVVHGEPINVYAPHAEPCFRFMQHHHGQHDSCLN